MTLTMSPNTLTSPAPWRLPALQSTLLLSLTMAVTLILLPLAPTALALLNP